MTISHKFFGELTLDSYDLWGLVTAFVRSLQTMQINIILKDSKTLVASDYMIEPSSSNQILCVYRKLNGDLIDIASES